MGFGLPNMNKKVETKNTSIKKDLDCQKSNKKSREKYNDDLNNNDSNKINDLDTTIVETVKNTEKTSSDISDKISDLNVDESNISSIELTEVDEIPVAEVTPTNEKIKLNAALSKSEKAQKYKKTKKK